MTEVMPHPVNIRKRRIMEALKDEAMYNEPVIQERAIVFEEVTEEIVYDDMLIYEDASEQAINNETTLDADAVEAANDEEATISVDLDNLTHSEKSVSPEALREKLLAEHKSDFNIMDMKLSLLDNWEESKRNTLEHMVKDLGELESLQDRLDSLLELLANRNLEIDENDYNEFQKKELEENPIYVPLDELREQSQSQSQLQTPKRLENQMKRIKISATSTPISAKRFKKEIIETFVADGDGLVVIGPNGTTIAKTALAAINWSLSGAALTRKILMEVFDRDTLAFHTLTGKPSPAFMDCDKPMKNQLDPPKVADIIHLVMEHTKLTAKEVRNAITAKCADENKMFRQREKKRLKACLKMQQKK